MIRSRAPQITVDSIADAFIAEAIAANQHLTAGYKEFIASSKDSLITYHHTMGRNIRNHYKLWEADCPLTSHWHSFPDERNMIEGVDHSDDHPDSVSMRIIEAIHGKLQ